MTDRTDDATRSIELEVIVPGTPDEVWQAIATGPGITSWYTPFAVDERVGGEVVMDWGSFGTTTAEVDVWDPPHRFRYSGRDEGVLAFEWLVEARDGASCVVRLVNSGFGAGAEFDDQYHGMTEGWKVFLENLRLQLSHFPGRFASETVIPTVSMPGPNDRAWTAFCGALGVPSDASVGDRIRTGGDVPALGGRVEAVLPRPAATYLVLVDHPVPGTAFLTVEGEGEQVAASAWLYLHPDAAHPLPDGFAEHWTSWLFDRFTPAGATAGDG